MIRRLQLSTFDATVFSRMIEQSGGEIFAVTPGGHFDGRGIWMLDETVVIWFRATEGVYDHIKMLGEAYKRPPKEV